MLRNSPKSEDTLKADISLSGTANFLDSTAKFLNCLSSVEAQIGVRFPIRAIGSQRSRLHERPVAAVRKAGYCCGADSPDWPFVHRAAFSEDEGRQCGLSDTVAKFSVLRRWDRSHLNC